MQINEAIGVLDKYFGDLQLNPREVAWQCIRKELVECQKPSPNRAMVPCEHKFIVYFDCVICAKCRAKFTTENAQHQ